MPDNNPPIRNIAKWNGSTWSALGSDFFGEVGALAVDSAGNLYAGEASNNEGVDEINQQYSIAKWDGKTRSTLDSSNNVVCALKIDGAGSLYAGGKSSPFITQCKLNGVSTGDIAILVKKMINYKPIFSCITLIRSIVRPVISWINSTFIFF
jgi:hypothetical protein